MAQAEVWTGQEIDRFEGVQAMLRSASLLIGRDDSMASLVLKDAIETLRQLLGEAAAPVAVRAYVRHPPGGRGVRRGG